jgi:hypothetical protein
MFQVIVVGADSSACSKVTVPLTVESPRTTATVKEVRQLLVQGLRQLNACKANGASR